MLLFLVRHGETVDNVAKLYAGARDSALTVHGVLQARRLGEHLAKSTTVRYLFSSDMQRAVKTAEAIRDAQPMVGRPDLLLRAELREKDFGKGEGVPFGEPRDKTGAESAEKDSLEQDVCIVVAHGLILGSLFRELCCLVHPSQNMTLSSEASRHGSAYRPATISPSWSNTGYLRAALTLTSHQTLDAELSGGKISLKLHITDINCTDHLEGLERTRGGIGRGKFDEKQKSINAFFTPSAKKRKADEDAS